MCCARSVKNAVDATDPCRQPPEGQEHDAGWQRAQQPQDAREQGGGGWERVRSVPSRAQEKSPTVLSCDARSPGGQGGEGVAARARGARCGVLAVLERGAPLHPRSLTSPCGALCAGLVVEEEAPPPRPCGAATPVWEPSAQMLHCEWIPVTCDFGGGHSPSCLRSLLPSDAPVPLRLHFLPQEERTLFESARVLLGRRDGREAAQEGRARPGGTCGGGDGGG